MKKKIIIITISILLLTAIILLLFLNKKDEMYTITLDINPSIELKVDKNDEVKNVIALNEDAQEIISDDLNNKNLDEALTVIINNLVDKGYTSEIDSRGITIILYSEKNKENIKNKIEHIFGEYIHTEIIIVDNITDEDKDLAEQYHISPAKVSYIKSITEDNKNITTESLIDKNVEELVIIKESKLYCDEGFTLSGEFCEKEIERKNALTGNVCPINYFDYKEKCYKETPIEETNNYLCNEGSTLEGDKCIRTEIVPAQLEYTCDKGELMKKGDVNPIGASDNDKLYCIDKSTGKAPTLRCLTSSYHTIIGGKCYNGPAPTINGGCPNGDTLLNGGCYSKDNEDQYVCPNGNIYEKSKGTYVELCPDTFTYTEPKIKGYKCENDFELKDKKCIKKEEEQAQRERTCPTSYTLIDNFKCINYNDVKNKENRLYCEDDRARLEDTSCVIYDIVEAKHN